jgi:7-keto-8-aminopelargonate synthetase-like enzyme
VLITCCDHCAATDTGQIELRLRYKFRLILDETWSFGVLGRTGRGITEHQHVDPTEVDMIIGSLAGSLCAGGGFCAGSDEIVEHQRISAAAYTFSAALPAMMATSASETLAMLQTTPDLFVQLKENIKAMWAQLDPRSDWVYCTSSPENPIMILLLKKEVAASRRWSVDDQQAILQDVVDEVRLYPHLRSHPLRFSTTLANYIPKALANGVLITRLKSLPRPAGASSTGNHETMQPALKVCLTTGLTKKEVEKAGITIRHAITKVVKSRK